MRETTPAPGLTEDGGGGAVEWGGLNWGAQGGIVVMGETNETDKVVFSTQVLLEILGG